MSSKENHYSTRQNIRIAPLQRKMIEYVTSKYSKEFPSYSDFIRKAITLQAKNILSKEEYEFVCSMAFKEYSIYK